VAKIEGIQLGLTGEEAEALLRELNAIIGLSWIPDVGASQYCAIGLGSKMI
jgi:hypothetical protein